MPNPSRANLRRVRRAFDRDTLAQVCELPEHAFGAAYWLERFSVGQEAPADYYYYADRGSDVLAVAHLDTVARPSTRTCRYVDTAAGPVVFSRALDDRLGAYVILDLLPRLGINCDVLLTTGEEVGRSTAAFFEPGDRQYNWIIEFDRGGTDVVLYQYDDPDTRALVETVGADISVGSFSDIADLEHLGCKAFNWGIGYQDYHSARSHAYLDDTFAMVARFLAFHDAYADTPLPHDVDMDYRPDAAWSWNDEDLNTLGALNVTWPWEDDPRSTNVR
jgi:hypothetical protein